MKRRRIDLNDVATYANLAAAAQKAARGKHRRRQVRSFFNRFDDNINRLGRDILNGNVPAGNLKSFRIFDPKERIIHAACFKDRVLHHALMNLAGPVLDRALVASSFACRPGKGIHSAAAYVQSKLRKHPWYVKIDIQYYFDSIDHDLLLRLLAKRLKGRDFMTIVAKILSFYQTTTGQGLPIGALTSQHFANYYLDGLDRYILEQLKASAHVRYMDDIVFWCPSKAKAQKMLAAATDYARDKRRVRVKPSSVQINQSKHGIRFCGFRILPGTIRLGQRRKKRYGALRRKWENLYRHGLIDAGKLQSGYDAVHAITLHADSQNWRKMHLQRMESLDA